MPRRKLQSAAEIPMNVPSAPGSEKDIPADGVRRSARIAAMKCEHTTKEHNKNEESFLKTRSKPTKPRKLVSKEDEKDKENKPVNTHLPDLSSLNLTSNKVLSENSGLTLTPVKKFQVREGIRTPGSSYKKRNSASPHPHNFLRKVEDPIVQRIDSPIRTQLKDKPLQESQSAARFNQIVKKEELKFKESCGVWNKILEDGSAPESFQGQILSAIGQANLFQNKRFKQFKELIELHKDENAEKKATEEDLVGFWEMIYYQVEDVHKRFSYLDDLKSRNWEEEKKEPIQPPKPSVPQAKTKATVKNVGKKPVSSKFKLFRQQMLAKKQVEKTDEILIL